MNSPMSYASQMFEVWMLREFFHIWAFFHSVSSPRMPFPPTQAYLHLANFSSSKDLNKSFWIFSSPSQVLNPVRPRLSCYLRGFTIKHQTNSFRAGLRLAHFGLSSALHNTAGGKQIFSEWRNGNASISSENIRFQYPWKRMQMNDEVDQKKKKNADHTEGKRMRRAVKATSGHTGVLQKFDDPLQWYSTSSVVAAVFHSGTNCVISSYTHAFWKPTTNTQIYSTEQEKEEGGLESISLKRQTSSLT